jgi:serine/threonine-protein kinase
MSPEQAMGREIDGRSDIFSLGAMLYEMITGQYAFDGDSLPTILYRVINEAPAPATSLRPQLPAGLASLLTRMLNKNPHDRPDARELVNALHALAPAAPQLPVAPPSNRIPRLLPVVAFGMPLVVFLLIGVGIIVIEHFLAPSQRVAPAPAGPTTQLVQDNASRPAADASTEIEDSATSAEAARPAPKAVVKPDPYLAGLDKKQVELRILRTELLLQYTEQHPDVMQVDRQLEQLRIERRNYVRQLKKNSKNSG